MKKQFLFLLLCFTNFIVPKIYAYSPQLKREIEALNITKVGKLLEKEKLSAHEKQLLLNLHEINLLALKNKIRFFHSSCAVKIAGGLIATLIGSINVQNLFKLTTIKQIYDNQLELSIKRFQQGSIESSTQGWSETKKNSFNNIKRKIIFSTSLTLIGLHQFFQGLTRMQEKDAYKKALAVKALLTNN